MHPPSRFLIFIFVGLTFLLVADRASSERLFTTIDSSKGGVLRVAYSEKWEAIDTGIEYNETVLISGESYIRAVLKFVRLDPARINAKVLVSEKMGSKNGFFARNLAKRTGAALIINGSYFDKNRKPLGFLVSDGKTVNKRVVTNWIYSGMFYIKNGIPFIVNRSKFSKGIKVEQALQAGPRLIADGRPIKQIKNLHASHLRSGIGLSRKNKIIVFATDTKYSGITWYELQQVLRFPGVQCVHAMNLDGGGSTQMAIVTKRKKEFIDGTSKVPVAIGFFEK